MKKKRRENKELKKTVFSKSIIVTYFCSCNECTEVWLYSFKSYNVKFKGGKTK